MELNYHIILSNYCDINQLPFHDSRNVVIDYIIDNPTHIIAYYTPYSWLFVLMQKLISSTIDLEFMMNSGDISHPTLVGYAIPELPDCVVIDNNSTKIADNTDISTIFLY